MNWLKRLWSNIWGDVIIRKIKPHPERDKLIYGKERQSLRDRFNKVRACCGNRVRPYSHEELQEIVSGSARRLVSGCTTQPVTSAEVDAYMEKMMNDLKEVPYVAPPGTDDYRLRFNLENMTGSCENAKGMDL